MKKAMTLSYETGGNLYLNITNQCPCTCTFCIRKNDDGAYGSDPLWLEHEPDFAELKADLDKRDLSKYPEIVFCGYGEPTMRLTLLCQIARYLKSVCPSACLRVNTNGLTELYNSGEARESAPEQLAACVDKVSISLNGGNAAVYNRVTRPKGMPEEAYAVMLHFAEECKALGLDVLFTVVDVITPEEIEEARKIAVSMGIPLSVRKYIA